ncbi:MAG: hypothetical protein KKF46_02665 [Nanoarchaeota archaeon]|nr:hypothetical protein [Nanoarchaeota archaeon]MBU1321234.1 hypothetical protein [Nanoarchaeota archaeon]MBU1597039.1 hypothetical protein [Nanoarchaeota archaeon]MBU2441815.1 hypothetical protein [Nanoarchaeota archaeon]
MGARLRPEEVGKREFNVAKFEVDHEEVMHLKNLYKLVHAWLVDEGFSAADGKPGDDKFETLYLERINQAGMKENHIWWRAVMIPRGNRYYRYFLKIDWQILAMKTVEIMHKGQKFKTNKGEIIMRVEAWLQLDYRNEWEKSGLLSRLEMWFRERHYLKEIKSYKKDLYKTAYRLHSTIKQFMNLKMPVPWGKSFHAEKGTYTSYN